MIRVLLDGVVKSRGGAAVLDGATLELEPGALTCLLGPAGAGKSTLARIAAGLERPDGGEVYLGERMSNALSPVERGVGYVPTGLGLWPALRVSAQVELPLRARGTPRAERKRRLAETLTSLRITSLARRRPARLSPLEQVRTALARAVVATPRLLILDDPLASLERSEREEFRDELRRVAVESGATTLITSSDPAQALAIADQLAVIDQGKILQTGPARELYNRPIDVFVARILGPTNLIQGQVEGLVGEPAGELVVKTPLGRFIGRGLEPIPTPGSPVTISIRPEALSTSAAVPVNWNRFPATLDRVIFTGAFCQVHAHGKGDVPITIAPLQWQTRDLKPGHHLTLSVAPEHVVVLPGRFAVTSDRPAGD